MSWGNSAFASVLRKRRWSTFMTPLALSQSIAEPWDSKNDTSLSRSVMSGTFVSVTGSSVSSVAQRMGSTEFLLPDGVMVPERGLPPLTTRSAMENKKAPARSGRLGMRSLPSALARFKRGSDGAAALLPLGAGLAAPVAPRAAPVAPAPVAAVALAAAVLAFAAVLALRAGSALERALASESLGVSAVAASAAVA